MGSTQQPNNGNDENNSSGSGWNDEDFNGLWGWLDGLLSGIKSVWQTLTNLPGLIADALGNLFSGIKNAVLGLPQTILNGLKAIFIPDMNEMKSEFTNLVDSLNPNRNTLDTAGDVFGEGTNISGREPGDVYKDIDLGLVKFEDIKLVDYSAVKTAVDYFRPVIQGLLTFLIGLYWYKEFLSFIGQAHNMGNAVATYQESKEDKQ